MAYQDARLIVSGTATGSAITGQTLTGTDTSVLSTYSVDLGIARDIGEGEDLFMRVTVTTAQTGGTSVEYQCVAADDAALTSNLVVLGSTGAQAVAGLTAGARFIVDPRPLIGSLGKRYIGARAVTVGAVAAGAAYIDFGVDFEDGAKFYASGYTVS
ncbi:hypothetical protein CU669_15105 [Paramagnetospirillum kuznetsovii]|uniref:Uncharacterized protein n=1 Tax=Paramagnetospirillum kuznetsovii TaxID=2053833 RepID=A0A364NVJ8_9PROT|nr:hypothetical protein [Paramagnetospirillum kuznetsovii]RAU21082.1 hypothetical protein CU669_15105 [Paramagnetospirillum kuznetsovii]